MSVHRPTTLQNLRVNFLTAVVLLASIEGFAVMLWFCGAIKP